MMTLNASTIESWVDFIDDSVDQLAPIVAPELPEVALAVPAVDALRKMADTVLRSPLVTGAQTATVNAAMTQLGDAVSAQPAGAQ
jgi:hypothetical protein